MAREGLMDDSGYNGFEECPRYEDCCKDSYDKGREEAIEKFNNKVDYLKEHYTDTCNMCTKMECDVCAIDSIIEDLEQLKDQKNDN